MKAIGNLQLYSLVVIFLSTLTAAWPWPRWLPEVDALVARQNDNNNNNNNNTSTSQGASNTAIVASTNSGAAATTGPSGTAMQTGSSTAKGSGSSVTSSAAQSTSFDARLPAGGISLLDPNIMSGSQFYKIGDYVTFAWNYTSLLATPTAINIMASCTANEQLYTIAMNQTVGNSTGAVTWDTGAYQATAESDPLLTEIYTLIIYDAASSISATAQAGYLAVYDQYQFGMYTPQPYTPLNEYECATCSGALSDIERRALAMVFGMACITVLSFTWFVGGLGVVW